jgi:haloalkane dehalogenase
VLRTPESCFRNLPSFPFKNHYITIHGVRVHYLDEIPMTSKAKHGRDGGAQVVVCLHGSFTWSYLYRNLVPYLVQAGYRVLVPDFIGFGRSDKVKQVRGLRVRCDVRSGWGGDGLFQQDMWCVIWVVGDLSEL